MDHHPKPKTAYCDGNIRPLDFPLLLLFLAISGSPLLGPAARGYELSKLLNGIAAVADVITDLYVTSDTRLTTGSSSSNVIAGL
jgi:hypothetical protein